MPVTIREAMYYKEIGNNVFQCELCPHYCVIPPNEQGKCRSRENLNGRLWAVNYAHAAGIAEDPIEKKPLYHFRPGSKIMSLGPNSCNLNCRWRQNYEISQLEIETINLNISDLYSLLLKSNPATMQIAFTYSEPLTWYEYILDFATQNPDAKIVLVSNGFINPEPLARLLPHIAAMNVDLKGITDSLYRDYCGGNLAAVKSSIRQIYAAGVHLELTLLLIPGLNDNEEELVELVDFVASINREIPLHISAYHPAYKMSTPPTSYEDIARARNIALQKLDYVYGGNLLQNDFRDTRCPVCKELLIRRSLQHCESHILEDGKCPACGKKIYGIYDQ
jgi:pyruvate formate lyase activating enzyme